MEQWEEFEWSATGEEAFAANGASDWGSEAPVGSFGSSGGDFGSRAGKGKMKPDAPEFVPKSVLLAQTKKEPKSEAKPETSGSRGESSGAGPSSSAGGSASSAKAEEGSKRPVSAPKDGREIAAQEDGTEKGKEAAEMKDAAERPGSAPDRKGKGIALDGERPTSAPKTAQSAVKDASADERPTSAPSAVLPKRTETTTEALNRGSSLSKMESARDALAAGLSGREVLTSSADGRLEAARGILGSGGARVDPGRSLLGSGSGRLESARDLLGSGGDNRARSTSPVVPLPPALLAVQAGRMPMLNRPCNFAMGQVRRLVAASAVSTCLDLWVLRYVWFANSVGACLGRDFVASRISSLGPRRESRLNVLSSPTHVSCYDSFYPCWHACRAQASVGLR